MAPEEQTWNVVVAALQQNPVLQPMGDEIYKTAEYSLKSFTLLTRDGTPDYRGQGMILSSLSFPLS